MMVTITGRDLVEYGVWAVAANMLGLDRGDSGVDPDDVFEIDMETASFLGLTRPRATGFLWEETMSPVDGLDKWADIVDELEGYRSWRNEIDAEWAEGQCCPRCGAQMVYEGWQRNGSQRSFARCMECDLAAEF